MLPQFFLILQRLYALLYILYVVTKPACPFVVSPAISLVHFEYLGFFFSGGGLNSILLSVCLSVPSFCLIPDQNTRIHFNESLFRDCMRFKFALIKRHALLNAWLTLTISFASEPRKANKNLYEECLLFK